MPAINRKNMRREDRLHFEIKSNRRFPVSWHPKLLVAQLLVLAVLLAAGFGCAPSSSSPQQQARDGRNSSISSGSGEIPELTEVTISERINDAGVWEVPEENGQGEPISWRFAENEPKEIAVIDKQIEGDRATIVLDIKTRSAPNARSPRYLAGQIRTEWELKTGWVLRRWEIVRTENISMKYKLLPKPAEQNSNR